MELSHSKIHDIITRAKKKEPLTEKEYSYSVVSREEVLGMSLLPGEAVIDRETGKEGEVIYGTKAAYVEG